MVTADVVPYDAVLVDVVKDAQAGFGRLVDLKLGVVRLSPFEVAGRAPWLVRPASWLLVSAGQLDSGTGPEPAVDDERLEICAVIAALEVAETAAGPDVRQLLYGIDHNKTINFILASLDARHLIAHLRGVLEGPCRSRLPSRC